MHTHEFKIPRARDKFSTKKNHINFKLVEIVISKTQQHSLYPYVPCQNIHSLFQMNSNEFEAGQKPIIYIFDGDFYAGSLLDCF